MPHDRAIGIYIIGMMVLLAVASGFIVWAATYG